MKKAKIFQDNFIRVYKKLHRKEIVEWAKKYNNPQEFWNDIKDSTLVDLEERYDIEGGVIKVLGGKDDSYYFELDKLGIEYTLPKKLQNKKK